MKKTIYLLTILAISFTGCEDYLEEPIRSRATLTETLANAESIEGFINGAYDGIQSNAWNHIVFYRQIMDMATDDCWAGNTEQPRPDIVSIAHYNNVDVGSIYFQNFWDFNFRGIARCNVILQEVPNVDIDEDLASRFLGEAYFLRAFFYFQLVQNFGGIPITLTFDELLGPDIANRVRNTEDEVYELIEADLLEAVERLPLKSEYSAADLGRATKGAAQSYLAKVYLFRERWAEAATLANNVIQSGEYALEPDFANLWDLTMENSDEVIFEVRYRSDEVDDLGNFYGVTTGSRGDGGWNWGVPSSHLEQAYLDEGDNIRLRSTIIKHGEEVFGDPDVTEFNGAPDRNKSGRINRKFYVPVAYRDTPYRPGNLNNNYKLMRYADLLLMYAEASYFAGNTSEALGKLEMVRDRVNLTTDMSLSGEALRDAIWKERRLELALEHKRLFDLRRQKVNGEPRINAIMGPEGTFVNYNLNVSTDEFELTNGGEDQAKGSTFDASKHLLWPVPTSEIILSEGRIVQNPGYN